MKEHTVCFTGHRKIPPEQVGAVSRRLEKTVLDLIEQGYRYFGAGGALGFDTIAAQTVLNLKIQYPEIRLILVLPCYSQTHGWNKNDKYIYEICRKKADKVVYISKAYSPD